MFKTMRHLAVLAAIVGGISLPSTSASAAPNPTVFVGFDLGAHIVGNGWDLMGGDGPVLNDLSSGAAVSLRVGGIPMWMFSVEGALTLITAESVLGNANHILRYTAGVLVHPFKDWDYAPHFSAGLGGYSHVSGDVGPDEDFVGYLGAGFRGMINDHVAVRADLQWNIADAFDGAAHNVMLTVGLDAIVWRDTPDSDGDGVANDEDACPQLAGERWTRGCPDGDGDGLADIDDKCPKQSGSKDRQGCPALKDADGDGVADTDDNCPKEKGLAAFKGCPDSDGDGIPDASDACPKLAGVSTAKGCPDKDGDGVADAEDACPNTKGVPASKGCEPPADTDRDGIPDASDMCPAIKGLATTKGCPDKDGDGVADEDDDCPDKPGPKENNGCLPKDLNAAFDKIKGLRFQANSATIQKASSKVLEQLAKLLAKYPETRFRIEGHTDNQGPPEANLALSSKRAEAVKAYLVDKGIKAERLRTKGFGETKPIASNDTKSGRAKNRRVEFVLVK